MAVLFLAAAAVSGCGGSKRSPTASNGPPAAALGQQGQQAAEKAQIAMGSAAKLPSAEIAARYTCKGANESMPFAWAGVGASAKEVVLMVRTFGPKGSGLKVNWIVAGISPSLQRIEAGKAPPGSIVGRNSFGQVGYSLCPDKTSPRTIVSANLLVYPKKLSFKPGWELHDLSSQVEGCNCVEWGSLTGFIV